jgi:hypothetical protein
MILLRITLNRMPKHMYISFPRVQLIHLLVNLLHKYCIMPYLYERKISKEIKELSNKIPFGCVK